MTTAILAMGSLNTMIQQWGEEAEPAMREEVEPEMREEAEEEASDEPVDDLGRAIADAKRNCEIGRAHV